MKEEGGQKKKKIDAAQRLGGSYARGPHFVSEKKKEAKMGKEGEMALSQAPSLLRGLRVRFHCGVAVTSHTPGILVFYFILLYVLRFLLLLSWLTATAYDIQFTIRLSLYGCFVVPLGTSLLLCGALA